MQYRIKKIGDFYYPLWKGLIFWNHFYRGGIRIETRDYQYALEIIQKDKNQNKPKLRLVE